MPKDRPIPLPSTTEGLIAWAIANPDAVRAALELVNRIAALEYNLVPPGGRNTLKQALVFGDDNVVLPIPLQLPNPYEAPTGTLSRATFATSTVTTEQLAQRVAALITDLRATGQAPSA